MSGDEMSRRWPG